MPVVITKRFFQTFAGSLVLVTFVHGNESFDYTYDVGRGVYSEDVALAKMARDGFMTRAYALFLAEVGLGREPHDVEITAKETA